MLMADGEHSSFKIAGYQEEFQYHKGNMLYNRLIRKYKLYSRFGPVEAI